MSARRDPLTTWRAAGAAAVVAALVSCGLLGWWALSPLDADEIEAQGAQASDADDAIGAIAEPRFDPAIFAQWFAEGSASPAPPPPSPVREPAFASATDRAAPFELLGVIENATSLQAALYDVKENRVVILGSGGEVGSHRVTMITRHSVDVSDGANSWRLTLRSPGAHGKGGTR